MTVYDEVNNLAKAIRDSKEYKEYKTLKDELMKTPELKAKVDEFEKIRYEEQLLAMQGEQQTAEKMKKLQELYEILVKNPSIKEYFDNWHSAEIVEIDDETLQIFFESRWDFPLTEMEKMVKDIPDKEDIDLQCLSVEWGTWYTCFHVYQGDEWKVY